MDDEQFYIAVKTILSTSINLLLAYFKAFPFYATAFKTTSWLSCRFSDANYKDNPNFYTDSFTIKKLS